MAGNFSDPEDIDFEAHKAKIMVFGAGGGGSNTINRLTEMNIQGAKTVALNTDARHLKMVNAHDKILMGKELTRGLGAGGYPEIGKRAAEESKSDITRYLEGCDLLFLTCGLGGGTGTGASPEIAKYAKQAGAIVISTVTLPFKMEGARVAKAEEGLMRLRDASDTVIVIENQKLVESKGGIVFIGTHLFSGLSSAMRKKFNTYEIGDIVANTLRVFGQGMKVVSS